MRTPQPLQLRVLVMGASASVQTSRADRARGSRADLAYPRVLEKELLAAGQRASVRVSAMPGDRARMAFSTWVEGVMMWSPDVVILHYGHADMVHLFLPRWLERHANSARGRRGPVRDRYRRYGLRVVWIALAKIQMRLDGRLDAAKHVRRQRRVGVQVATLIAAIGSVGSPLILVPTILRPGPPWEKWFPGSPARMAAMNATLDAVVRQANRSDVRVFPLAELVESLPLDGEEPTPDGGHFTPAVHREIGRAMAKQVLEWATAQSHLRLSDDLGASLQ